MKMFLSDNNSGVHPKILGAINNCNIGHDLEEYIWKENAINSNNMSKYLKEELEILPGVEIMNKSLGNILFVKILKRWNGPLQEEFPVYLINEKENIIRLVTSFDTTEEDIESFINYIKDFLVFIKNDYPKSEK